MPHGLRSETPLLPFSSYHLKSEILEAKVI